MSQSKNANEAVPVIEYIVAEMNHNANGTDARRIKQLNSFQAEQCIREWRQQSFIMRLLTADTPKTCVEMEETDSEAAILAWAMLVRQNGRWDHKPYLRRTFHPRGPGEQVWHRLGDFEYYYDVWSNIHYGYVGVACGFSGSTLREGAGLEQMGSDVLRGRAPQSRPGASGLAAYDDPSDQIAIQIGVTLYSQTPVNVTSADVRSMLEAVSGLDKRAVNPETGAPT